jgi:histidinol phosphatase-like PHP family hydrolase
MRDMHVHTEFSCDSEAKIEDCISESKKKSIYSIETGALLCRKGI